MAGAQHDGPAMGGHTPAALTAIAGVLIMTAGWILAIAGYNQSHPAAYSPLNHFVSELGWVRASAGAWLFNRSLSVGVLLFIPLIWAVGRHLGTRLGRAAAAVGIATALSGSAVGFLPLDRLAPHLMAACCYFWGLLFMGLLFTLAFRFSARRARAKWPMLASLAVFLLCTLFLAYPKDSVVHAIRNTRTFQRPPVWHLAVMEWSVVLATNLWVLTTAAYLSARRETPDA